MGGRGPQHRATQRAEYEHLVRMALRLWPALAGVSWTHWWNGQFALTPDFYPRLHLPERNLLIALGYSGRGVALATALGAQLAAACSGAEAEDAGAPGHARTEGAVPSALAPGRKCACRVRPMARQPGTQ